MGQIHFVLVCAGARPLIRASSFDQSFLISDCLTSATAPAARGRCRCTSSSSTSTRTWPHTSRSARRPASRQIGSRWVTQNRRRNPKCDTPFPKSHGGRHSQPAEPGNGGACTSVSKSFCPAATSKLILPLFLHTAISVRQDWVET